MSGLGGLNKSKHGVVVGLVQLQLPVVETPAQLAAQTQRICDLVAKARRNQGTMDLVVFPEYALHGLSMSIAPGLMVSLDGPEVAAFKQACIENHIWGCFSIMEANPGGNPYNSGLIIDDTGVIRLYYRKLHPWVPVEPWEPGNLGVPVCDGPNGSRLSLIICHDGMFPEMAREAAYKGAEIILRTAGYTAPIRHAWKITNQANAFQNLAITASVCLCGSDGTFDSMGEGMFCSFDGTVIAEGGGRRAGRRNHHRRTAARSGARGAPGLGRGKQPLPALPPRLCGGEGWRAGLPLHLHARHGRRHLPPALAGRRDRRHALRLRRTHTFVPRP
ncbi:formamidase [Hydrogenophaga sp.]|uniref:formamidase n=1 Tax=Hydrogenophaga sp. TaxID=1904254 RepID=UPI002736CEDE|nr:formamidase [Hydrogenophaga sp.]MDP3885087.1 formamidase [Hydrogenophaga sp.]MDZ4357534.1 formamidase [Variovorax sp.]